MLEGKVALVTGASRGLGKSIALILARAGAEVALTARDENALAETASEIRALGGKTSALAADLRDPKTPATLVEEAVRELGGMEILVNNAGLGNSGAIETVTEERWDEVLDTNLKATFLLCQAAAPRGAGFSPRNQADSGRRYAAVGAGGLAGRARRPARRAHPPSVPACPAGAEGRGGPPLAARAGVAREAQK